MAGFLIELQAMDDAAAIVTGRETIAKRETVRVFIYEYASALGPLAPPSIRTEGRAMLAAVVEDFARIDGAHVTTLLHPDAAALGHEHRRLGEHEEKTPFLEAARRADFTLVIAPETGGVLAERCRWVLAAGGKSLGSSPVAIELTSDKLALSSELGFLKGGSQRDCVTIAPGDIVSLVFPLVCKPRDGAGSQATFLVRDRADLDRTLAHARQELPDAEFILQPFVAGLPASVAFIVGEDWRMPLPPCRQLLSDDGRFHYLGGECPLPDSLAKRASSLAERAVSAVPGLRGYVGVDLVLGDAADGSADRVIEINPRLTTSYIGLRQLASGNLAEAMLAAATGIALPSMNWMAARVRFTAAGDVEVIKPLR